jgi:SAM-dependent methyltransferase
MLAGIERLQLFVRTRSPRWLRTIYRVGKSFAPVKSCAPIPSELVQDCRFVASRGDLVGLLPGGGRVMEVGTYKGEFAREILARAAPVELHLVDMDCSRLDRGLLADHRVNVHKGRAHEVVPAFADRHFDWVYMDADHSYEGTLRDALAVMVKVKPGGFMVFNDFARIDPWLGRYGVQQAVVDFVRDHRWEFRIVSYDCNGLYDVAVQKPGRR